MKEKLTQAKNEFIRQIRKLSIISTLTVHLLYIAYLGYSLMNDIGIKPVNIALMVGTAVFLIVYLFLQLFGENRKSKLKTTKKFYKKFKLATKVFTTGTAIYSLATAAKSVSPFAMILSVVGAVFLAIRILTDILVGLISKKVKNIKENMKNRRERRHEEKKMKKLLEDMEVTEESCALSEEDLEIKN
jgi:hypothetical protein